MLLQLHQFILGSSIFWLHVVFCLKNALLSPRKLLPSFYLKHKWVRQSCTSNHMGMGLSLKAGVGTPSCKMENLNFHFHGIQGFTRNTVCTPHSTHMGALFPFSWLLSLALKPRNLPALHCWMLSIWEGYWHGAKINVTESSELSLDLALTNAVLKILSQWCLQTPYNN